MASIVIVLAALAVVGSIPVERKISFHTAATTRLLRRSRVV
ncbi:hypothetical protein AB0F17_61945 [Nonomuraea sp. NPDC026600]